MLSETWTTERTPDRLLNISGYRLVRRDRPRDSKLARGHGGVALYVRECFETEVLSTRVTGVRNSNLEMLWVTVRVGKCRRLLIGSAYRVPKNTGEQLTADLDDLETQLQHMLVIHPGLTVVLGGDINCCILKSDTNNSPGNRLRSLLDRHGLQICNIAVPTYRPAGSLLDVLATNRSELVDRAGVTRCHYGTPHDYTRLALRLSEDRSRAGPAVRRRCLANVDKGQFNYQLLNADWTSVYSSAGPDDKWSAFVGTFTPLIDSVAPERRVVRRPQGAPPISRDTSHLLALRRTALSAGRDQEYRDLNRQSRAAIRADCRRHLQDELHRGGPSSMWKVLRPIIGTKKTSTGVSGITANTLNDYYTTVARDLAAAVPAPSNSVSIRLPRVTSGALKIQPISMEALWAIVRDMKPSTFTDRDGINVRMLQDFFPGLGHIIHDVVNASLQTGRVPGTWKHAIITPIPKGKQAPSDPSATRPISLLPAIMKVTERAVQLQLTEYMETQHLLSDAQHGYRKNRSCETALHVVTDDILRAMDRGEITLWAMVDLSKCFDMVPHDKLLEKLSLYGIDSFWLSDYLDGHTQQVQVTNSALGSVSRSSIRENTIGVYQGDR